MRSSFCLAVLILLASGATLAGCSSHDTPPATPVDSATTPTNRSFTNSTDQPNTPFYTQPGVNPGQHVALKPIPSQAGFSPNTPLALAVYNALSSSSNLDSHYIAAQSKGNVVLLVGSVKSAADKAQAEAIAKKQTGVTSVVDKLTVASGT
jgi:hypothetical protein